MRFPGRPLALYGSQLGAVGIIRGCTFPTEIDKRAPCAKQCGSGVPPGRIGSPRARAYQFQRETCTPLWFPLPHAGNHKAQGAGPGIA